MSSINALVTNDMVIPEYESDIFDGHSESRFAVGHIATGHEVFNGFQPDFDAYLKLRANVYVEQTNMLPSYVVDHLGREQDEDDKRSAHFVVVENNQGKNNVRLVGALRLILKSQNYPNDLPIEDFFPEAFINKAAPYGSAEVSRYISRHENESTQHMIPWLLYGEGMKYFMSEHKGSLYGVVERPLEGSLKSANVPIERIAEPKFIPEYNADNLAIEIDTLKMAQLALASRKRFGRKRASEHSSITYIK